MFETSVENNLKAFDSITRPNDSSRFNCMCYTNCLNMVTTHITYTAHLIILLIQLINIKIDINIIGKIQLNTYDVFVIIKQLHYNLTTTNRRL